MRSALSLAALLAALPALAQQPLPAVGDSWTYRLTQPGAPGSRSYTVTIGATSRGEILDQVVIERNRSFATRHGAGARMFSLAGGVFSPYLMVLDKQPPAALAVEIADAACTGAVICEASARVAGEERVTVPAGTFDAVKIVIEQSWRPSFSGSGVDAGARTVTVWYAPAPRRAVKYTSRIAFGDSPPMEANFDLELASWRIAPPPSRVLAAPRPPQIGDNWTYRISDPQREKAPRSVLIRIASVSPTLIVEHASVEGGFTAPWRHTKGNYLIAQGVSVFSPYLPQFEKLVLPSELGYIESNDPGCRAQFVCTAKGSIVGEEAVQVPAGRFMAAKVVIQQSWRPAAGTSGDAKELERMNGARTMTIWYSSELKRAVKYESRLASGERTPVEATYDIELMAYQLK
jgi:hypothetical protein